MLSLFSTADVAEPSSARLRTGIWLGSGILPVPKADLSNKAALVFMPEAALAHVRPQAHQAYLFGNGTQVAGQAETETARQQHTSNLKFAHKIRTATQGGGALGPHPARDPV